MPLSNIALNATCEPFRQHGTRCGHNSCNAVTLPFMPLHFQHDALPSQGADYGMTMLVMHLSASCRHCLVCCLQLYVTDPSSQH